MEISPGVRKLVEECLGWQKDTEVKPGENTISVDEVAARVASFYEKIRGVVDWREEHLLRKTAIERILKRRILMGKHSEDFAERFLQELVRGGHFPNNRIPISKIDEIQAIVTKYVFISEHHHSSPNASLGKIEDWLWSLAACEIEEALSLPRRERALIDFMYNELVGKIEIENKKNNTTSLSQEEKTLQVYVAVQRALFKLDHSTITYHIIAKFYPDWRNPSQDTLLHVTQTLTSFYDKIQKILWHPYSEKFYQIAERYDTPYLILGDIISDEPEEFLQLAENPSEFEGAMREAYNGRLFKLKGKIRRAAFYSTLSVFLTKVLLAFLIEIPVDRYFFMHELNFSLIGMSVAIPPLLMFFLVASAKTSSQQNFERVMIEVMKITRAPEKRELHEITLTKKRKSSVVATVVYGMYALSFLISFGVIIWILQRIEFSILSIIIFLMFLSLVSFAGTKIRQRAGELLIEREKEGFFYGIFDFFSLPMIQVGKWLSSQFVKYNLIALALSFLIEIPFQVFVEFIEQWRIFLKEKKEEIH